MRKRFLATAVWVLWSAPVLAQPLPITAYTVKYYNVGASAPVSSFTFNAVDVVCNQVPPPTNTVNPTRVAWDDPAVPSRVCLWVDPGTEPLSAVPLGSYEGTIAATNVAGTSPESPRAPFQRASVPPTLTGVRFLR